MLVVIAIANAVLWSGIIGGLLLVALRQQDTIEAALARLETRAGRGTQE